MQTRRLEEGFCTIIEGLGCAGHCGHEAADCMSGRCMEFRRVSVQYHDLAPEAKLRPLMPNKHPSTETPEFLLVSRVE